MKLEPNMYVRTKDGNIDKILFVEYAEEKRQQYPNHPSKKHWRDKILLLKAGYWRTTQNIIKASHNIIDLIEVGDYVNGQRVDTIQNGQLLSTNSYDFRLENIVLCNEDIKSIVTKEQFESMKYKIDRQLKRMEEENK